MLNIFGMKRRLKSYKKLYSDTWMELNDLKFQNLRLKSKNEVSEESSEAYIKERIENESKYNQLLAEYNKLKKDSADEIQSIQSQILTLEEKIKLQTNSEKESSIRDKKQRKIELNHILTQLNKKDLNTENLNFDFYKNKETQKYEVVLSFCQLCGEANDIRSFDTKVEAWIFCKIKTLNEEKIETAPHSECYREYIQDSI